MFVPGSERRTIDVAECVLTLQGHPRSMIFVSSERPVRRGKLSMVDGTLGIAVGPISSMSLASLMVSHLITGDEVN